MEIINSQKYVELQEKLQEEAKVDAIALLCNKVENHAIVIDDIHKQICDHDWIVTEVSNNHIINIPIVLFAYGLNKYGKLCFKAFYQVSRKDYKEGKWCEFEENGINNLYSEVYEIIAEHVIANQDAQE